MKYGNVSRKPSLIGLYRENPSIVKEKLFSDNTYNCLGYKLYCGAPNFETGFGFEWASLTQINTT